LRELTPPRAELTPPRAELTPPHAELPSRYAGCTAPASRRERRKNDGGRTICAESSSLHVFSSLHDRPAAASSPYCTFSVQSPSACTVSTDGPADRGTVPE